MSQSILKSNKSDEVPVFECQQCRGIVPAVWRPGCEGVFDPGWIPGECPACEEVAKRAFLEKENARMEEAVNNSGISERFKEVSFGNYEVYAGGEQMKCMNFVQQYANVFREHLRLGTWLFFSGSPGTGKNHLALSALQTIIRSGFSGFYIKAWTLFSRLKIQRDEGIWQRCMKDDLLIIDEVSPALRTPVDHAVFFEVVDARYESKKPLILVDNLDYRNFGEIVGPRVFDRFAGSNGKVVQFNWQSWRQRGVKHA